MDQHRRPSPRISACTPWQQYGRALHQRQRGSQLKRLVGQAVGGALLRLELLAGAPVKVMKMATGKVEERFGYAKGQEHTATTRIGLLLGF